MNETLPQPAPRVRVEGADILANSRDVAEWFEKRHDNVLRDVDALLGLPSDLRGPQIQGLSGWFREGSYLDGQGASRRCVDMTRDGFALLAMGFTGAKALEFKVRYIAAFNAQEEALREVSRGALNIREELAAIVSIQRETAEMSRALFATTSETRLGLVRVEEKVDGHSRIIGDLVARVEVGLRRRKAPGRGILAVKREVVRKFYGGLCPACRQTPIVADSGAKLPDCEADHTAGPHLNKAAHVWLICRPCNRGLGTGRIARASLHAAFTEFLRCEALLPGTQCELRFS